MLGNSHWEGVRALRALAHPIRLQLLQVAASEGSVTSTTASERTGESTANCSFHLRLLAKYGFLEPAVGTRGRRERPWRLASHQPLADLSLQLADAVSGPGRHERSELMRRQLRIFDPDDVQLAA
jgi:hypothetical protein